MNNDLPDKLKALEQLPDASGRSRLDPYRTVILRWRRRGWSYRRISKALRDGAGISAGPKTIWKFVKLRLRRKASDPELDAAIEAELQEQQAEIPGMRTARPETERASLPQAQGFGRTPEENAAMRERLAAARNSKPEIAVMATKRRFVFDPDKPRTKEKTKEG